MVSICRRGTEVYEAMIKRIVDECCIQEVRRRAYGAQFLGVENRRYKLWWSENDSRMNVVGILVKEE